MSIYKIAGIVIDFSYHFNDFFKDNIEKYQVSDQLEADYMIKVEILDTIDHPMGMITSVYKNRFVIETDDQTMIVVTDEVGDIIELIKHTKDYKNIAIKLSKKLNQRLAEKEYLLSGLMFSELAILEHKLSIHGSAFMVHDDGFIIAASSGTGKTTHANYWKASYDTFQFINDDKPLIHMKDHQFYVSGSPWSGKTKHNNNLSIPIKAIIFYHQGTINYIKALTTDEKLKHLLHHALRPRGEELMNIALDIMEGLIRYCPMFEYHALNNPSSVDLLYQKIYGG